MCLFKKMLTKATHHITYEGSKILLKFSENLRLHLPAIKSKIIKPVEECYTQEKQNELKLLGINS